MPRSLVVAHAFPRATWEQLDPRQSHCVKSGPDGNADSSGGAGPARAIFLAAGAGAPTVRTAPPFFLECKAAGHVKGRLFKPEAGQAAASAVGGAEISFSQEVWVLTAREPGSRSSPAQSPSHLCSWG